MVEGIIFGIILSINDEKDLEFARKLYDNYYFLIRKIILKTVQKNDSEVSDLVHDTYIQLIDKLQLLYDFKDKIYLLTSYISVVAKNTAINFIKRNDIKSNLLFYGEEEDIVNIPDNAGSDMPEELLIIRENSAELTTALEQMPDKYRLILQYKYFMDMTDKDIAQLFDLNSKSVKVYISRAKKMAYKLLKERNFEYEKEHAEV